MKAHTPPTAGGLKGALFGELSVPGTLASLQRHGGWLIGGLLTVLAATWAMQPELRALCVLLGSLLSLGPLMGWGATRPLDVLMQAVWGLGLWLIALVALWLLPPGSLPAPALSAAHDGPDALVGLVVLALAWGLAFHHARQRSQGRLRQAALQDALAQTQALATRDPLTGLFNQAHMADLARQEFNRAQRAGSPMSLALLSLDHLRRHNDKQGHASGDALLKRFAQHLGDALREHEAVGRSSGATFMIIFAGSSSAQAAHALTRLRQRLAQADAALSFSSGCCEKRDNEPLETLLRRCHDTNAEARRQGGWGQCSDNPAPAEGVSAPPGS